MIRLQIQSDTQEYAQDLIRSAIAAETARFELGLKITERHIRSFEERYHTTSDVFLGSMAAEDLAGGDAEYVAWAGELSLHQRLKSQLQALNAIQYAA
jgi:hypothetical protein